MAVVHMLRVHQLHVGYEHVITNAKIEQLHVQYTTCTNYIEIWKAWGMEPYGLVSSCKLKDKLVYTVHCTSAVEEYMYPPTAGDM